MQWLKATVTDRKVWLPTPACVVVAVHLSKVLKDAHSKGPSNLHVRAARFHWRLHLGKWSTHLKCMCQELALKIFTVFNIVFTIQDFWAICTCPENFHCIDYWIHIFIIQDFWATYPCPGKQSVPWIDCIEYIFLSFRIFEQLALTLKTEFALKFFKPGGAVLPSPSALYVYGHRLFFYC